MSGVVCGVSGAGVERGGCGVLGVRLRLVEQRRMRLQRLPLLYMIICLRFPSILVVSLQQLPPHPDPPPARLLERARNTATLQHCTRWLMQCNTARAWSMRCTLMQTHSPRGQLLFPRLSVAFTRAAAAALVGFLAAAVAAAAAVVVVVVWIVDQSRQSVGRCRRDLHRVSAMRCGTQCQQRP